MRGAASISMELRPTLRLALPIMASQVGQMLMGITDTLVVGHIGVNALAASAFVNSLLVVFFVFGIGVQTAISVLGSRSFGASRSIAGTEVLRAGLWLSVALGLTLALLTLSMAPLLRWFGQAPEVIALALPFLELLSWSLVPGLGYLGAKTFCDSQAKPFVPMWILLAGVVLNAVLNWILVFGNIGAPVLGLVGSAWATLLSRSVVLLGTTVYALQLTGGTWRSLIPRQGDANLYRSLLRLGLPVGVGHLAEVSAFGFAGLMIGWIGPLSLAAHQIAITCAAFAFMFPLGVAQAASVRIGHVLGSREHSRIRTIGVTGFCLSGAVMTLSAVTFECFGAGISRLFTDQAELVARSAELLVIAGLFQLADGIQVTAAGALRGLSDVRFPMLVGLFYYWAIAIPVGYVLGFVCRLGARGVWLGLAFGLIVAATVLTSRFLALAKPGRRFDSLLVGSEPMKVEPGSDLVH